MRRPSKPNRGADDDPIHFRYRHDPCDGDRIEMDVLTIDGRQLLVSVPAHLLSRAQPLTEPESEEKRC